MEDANRTSCPTFPNVPAELVSEVARLRVEVMRALIAALFPWSCCAPKSNGAIDLLWPTPVLSLHDPVAEATHKQLRKAILRIAAVEPGVQKTNQGGWQSAVDLFERNDAAFITLRTRAYHAAFKYLQNLAPAGTTGKFEVSLGSAYAARVAYGCSTAV